MTVPSEDPAGPRLTRCAALWARGLARSSGRGHGLTASDDAGDTLARPRGPRTRATKAEWVSGGPLVDVTCEEGGGTRTGPEEGGLGPDRGEGWERPAAAPTGTRSDPVPIGKPSWGHTGPRDEGTVFGFREARKRQTFFGTTKQMLDSSYRAGSLPSPHRAHFLFLALRVVLKSEATLLAAVAGDTEKSPRSKLAPWHSGRRLTGS